MAYEFKELSRSIAGKTAFITGAASGMGRACAHLFAREGANVAVTDLNAEGALEVARDLQAAGFDNVRAWALDVGDKEEIMRVVDEAARHFHGLDILINNAGFAQFITVEEDDYDAVWDKSVNVMMRAHQRLINASLPHLRASGEGRIVNIASTEGLGGTPGNSPYVAAKHGVIGITRGMANDLGREGITVNAICPGPIRTSINAAIPEDHKTIFAKRRVPLRRYGDPEEVAHIILGIVLPSASYLNGAVIPVDGGMMIKNA